MMVNTASFLREAYKYGVKCILEIHDNLGKNNLWKRILKNVIATTIAVSICLVPAVQKAVGRAAYLSAITTVFGHPGRRFGMMAEALILLLSGTVLGLAWSLLGIYLGSLVYKANPPGAYAIKGFFLAVAMIFHAFLRSRTPRLWIFLVLLMIVSIVSLTSTTTHVTSISVTQILYPILMAAGILLLVNLFIFPEFSSSFLGQMTIDTLNDTAHALENAGYYFTLATDPAGDTGEGDPASPNNADNAPSIEENQVKTQTSAVSNVFISLTRRIKNLFVLRTISPTKHEIREVDESVSLTDLTTSKGKLRIQLSKCKAAQRECNFEIAFSVLPLRIMKPISNQAMKKLVANAIAIVGACETKYALLGPMKSEEADPTTEKSEELEKSHDLNKDGNVNPGIQENLSRPATPSSDEESSGAEPSKTSKKERKKKRKNKLRNQDRAELDLIKPRREIEFGDVQLLQYLLRQVVNPYQNLQAIMGRTVDVVSACIAYVYDVPKLPSGANVPKGIILEEIDLYVEHLEQALIDFDDETVAALEGAAALQELQSEEPDIMPREEIFLISSFLLNLRQAASHILEMLKHSRYLVERREQRHGRKRLYAPRINWAKWLDTGDGEDEALPSIGRKSVRQGNSDIDADEGIGSHTSDSNESLLPSKAKRDVEKDAGVVKRQAHSKQTSPPSPLKEQIKGKEIPTVAISPTLRLRGQLADTLEWLQTSDDTLYAFKFTIAIFLVAWPAFVTNWNTWYSLNRGLWAAIQVGLITEVAIGTSVMTFIVRAIGTTLGCIWGLVTLVARNENPYVVAVMICLGIIPSAYVQLGTPYPKAGMVSIVSMCVVALSTELGSVPGTPVENYLKRYISFMIGAAVALAVEVVIMPVKARTRLVESLASALRKINEMESCIAFGIEEGINLDVYAPEVLLRFEEASGKANGALGAAETFLPFCSKEPRIKGSFEGLAIIYGEILFVLHEIVDRMDNMLQLRTAYGSGPLEEFNAQIYPYRRNVAGSITLTLFAIHEALITKLPLPQFLPSARLAHLRIINRVREVMQATVEKDSDQQEISKLNRQRAVRRKYMSWNAASAARAEIIEFLEELIELTKLLVGANEFRSGLLTRPTYREYVDRISEKEVEAAPTGLHTKDSYAEKPRILGLTGRHRGTLSNDTDIQTDVPVSLRRIQSRKTDAGLRKRATNDSGKEKNH